MVNADPDNGSLPIGEIRNNIGPCFKLQPASFPFRSGRRLGTGVWGLGRSAGKRGGYNVLNRCGNLACALAFAFESEGRASK
jgi:hypothetical protein